jgi:hypothetical protein
MADHVTGFTPPGSSEANISSLAVTSSTSDSSAPGPLVRVGGVPAIAGSDAASVMSIASTDTILASQATAYAAIRQSSRARRSASGRPTSSNRRSVQPVRRAEDSWVIVLGARDDEIWEVDPPLPHYGPVSASDAIDVDMDASF